MTAQEIYQNLIEKSQDFFFPEDINCYVFDINPDDWSSVDYRDYFTKHHVGTMTKEQFLEKYKDITTFEVAFFGKIHFDYYNFA